MNKNKSKKNVFTPKIDKAINGYAIGISFWGIGIFLLLRPDYFLAPVASYIVGAIVGIFGMLGIGIELSNTSKIKGFENIAFGIVFLLLWLFLYIKFNILWLNIPTFLIFLIFGCYSLALGIIQGIYSIFINIKTRKSKDETQSKSSIASQIILFLTQLSGLFLAVINVIKAIKS